MDAPVWPRSVATMKDKPYAHPLSLLLFPPTGFDTRFCHFSNAPKKEEGGAAVLVVGDNVLTAVRSETGPGPSLPPRG